MRTIRRALAFSGVALGWLLLVATGAYAGNFVKPNSNFNGCQSDAAMACMQDNSSMTYFRENLGTMMNYGVEQTLWQSYDTTDLVVNPDPNGHNSLTDVVYRYSSNLGEETLGVTRCETALSYYECGHYHVSFNGPLMIQLGWNVDTPAHRKDVWNLACHETGHTVGLTHGSDGDPGMADYDPVLACMRTPHTQDTSLGSHNVGHINPNY